jgi:hypothetical protein
MYFLYLDESGNANIDKIWYPDSDFFVLGGMIIKEEHLLEEERKFIEFRNGILPKDLVNTPLHAHLLYQISAGLKKAQHLDSESAKIILIKAYEYIAKMPIESIIVIIDNVALRKQYTTPENPYKLSHEFITEKFQKIINKRNEKNNVKGLINLSASSKITHSLLHQSQKMIISNGSTYVSKFDRVVGVLNIEPMKASPFYEVADLICYAFQRGYREWLCKNLNKKYVEENFLDIIAPICTNNPGKTLLKSQLNSFNVVLFPSLELVNKHRFSKMQFKEVVSQPPRI